MNPKPLLIAIGHDYRTDDGVGPWLGQKISDLYPDEFEYAYLRGDLIPIIDLWHDRRVIIIDAMHSVDGEPGSVKIFKPLLGDSLPRARVFSSHTLSLAELITLARTLGRSPRSLIIVAIEGSCFQPGLGPTSAIKDREKRLIQTVLTTVTCLTKEAITCMNQV